MKMVSFSFEGKRAWIMKGERKRAGNKNNAHDKQRSRLFYSFKITFAELAMLQTLCKVQKERGAVEIELS